MERIFHLVTRENDPLADQVIAGQEAAGHETRVLDLTQADPNGDYTVVLEEIFEADSVQVW